MKQIYCTIIHHKNQTIDVNDDLTLRISARKSPL